MVEFAGKKLASEEGKSLVEIILSDYDGILDKSVNYLVHKLGCDFEDARDIFQEFVVRIISSEKSRGYESGDGFMSYLRACLRNAYFNKMRAQRRIEKASLDLSKERMKEQVKNPIEDMIRKEESCALHRAIESISSDYNRRAIICKYLEDLSYEEIAEIEGIEQTGARTRVFYGIKELRNHLGRLAG